MDSELSSEEIEQLELDLEYGISIYNKARANKAIGASIKLGLLNPRLEGFISFIVDTLYEQHEEIEKLNRKLNGHMGIMNGY